MPTIRLSKPIRIDILPDNPLPFQYLQEHAPRRPNRLQDYTICEGEIEHYDFANGLRNGPIYPGTTYKVQLAKDRRGNPIDDVDLTASIPNEDTPLVKFDASRVTLTENNSIRNVRDNYYKIIVVQPGDDCYQSLWAELTIKARQNKPD